MSELIAENTFLLTSRGPMAPSDLKPGDEEIWVVTRDGGLALARLRARSQSEPTKVWRLLSSAGEVALPDGAYVSADGGRFLTGNEVAGLLLRGEEADVDIVSPADVEFSHVASKPGEETIRAALALLPRRMIQIPASTGVAREVDLALEKMLDSAEVSYRRIRDDRWLVFLLQDVPGPTTVDNPAFEEQAGALLLATAWETNGSSLRSRVRLPDAALLQGLIRALVGARRPFKVNWMPKYSPAECRIATVDEPSWGAFVAIDAAVRETSSVYELDLSGSGRPIAGLAVTTSRI